MSIWIGLGGRWNNPSNNPFQLLPINKHELKRKKSLQLTMIYNQFTNLTFEHFVLVLWKLIFPLYWLSQNKRHVCLFTCVLNHICGPHMYTIFSLSLFKICPDYDVRYRCVTHNKGWPIRLIWRGQWWPWGKWTMTFRLFILVSNINQMYSTMMM